MVYWKARRFYPKREPMALIFLLFCRHLVEPTPASGSPMSRDWGFCR